MNDRGGVLYGAIVWDALANIDDAIKVVKAFDNPDDARRLAALTCGDGQRWAVVHLETKRVVAQGCEPAVPAAV